MEKSTLRKEIEKHTLSNALDHEGKANTGSVVSRLLGEHPDLRSSVGEIMPLIAETVAKINSMSPEDQAEIARLEFPESTRKEKKVQEHRLPELRNVKGKVVMRLAPSPSGPLHIGHSRMAILNDEYVRRYGGDLILRIEDTNPLNIDPVAYEQIPRDLEWLGVNVTETVIQSDRMVLYYEEARNLISMGKMYCCSCEPETFKSMLLKSQACPHRDTSPMENLDQIERAISGKMKSREAVFVMKTDLDHPNPSVRDWIAFRIIDAPHPRQGKKFRLYPLMNFSVAVDDHLLGLTHVIRGKDHINNTEKQKYIFHYNKWKLPEYYHYGLVDFPDVILKTSIIKKGIMAGEYSGWDDIRLGTLMAFRKRGYRKETFRKYWVDSGIREIDSEFSKEIFDSIDRGIIEPTTPRLFYVKDPVEIRIHGAAPRKVSFPNHPTNAAMGFRSYDIGANPLVSVSKDDWDGFQDGDIFRLKDYCNIRKNGNQAEFSGTELVKGLKIVHWGPPNSLPFKVYRTDGTSDEGKIEPNGIEKRGVFQFERYGFVNVSSDSDAYYLHR
ncbi:MAG: glutamate--tRNA ligase [Candidatus Thermoplasmatota archaeon]|nr:glutamate--tRNA ligase [Candidatus Thermoplasmatota archaeon]